MARNKEMLLSTPCTLLTASWTCARWKKSRVCVRAALWLMRRPLYHTILLASASLDPIDIAHVVSMRWTMMQRTTVD